jgi:hypothetical protein
MEDRIMAVEPFVDQALRDSTRQRFISERDLGLDDDDVQSGVQLFIRQADAGAAVIQSAPDGSSPALSAETIPLLRYDRR